MEAMARGETLVRTAADELAIEDTRVRRLVTTRTAEETLEIDEAKVRGNETTL